MEFKIPYRINIAGAYLDCIEEPVITATIDKYLTFSCNKRDDDVIIVDSKEFPGLCITDLMPHVHLQKHWAEYVNGCVAAFTRNNFKLKFGCDIIVENDLPSGIGISSSAAFIVGIVKCIAYANDLDLSADLVAGMGYWVEHDYLNIPCGRMDFKAVLHEPGLWKVETVNNLLSDDYLVDTKHYIGLLLYKEQHEHITDEKFVNIVRDIKDAKYNFKENLLSQYINFEKNIVDCLVWRAQDNKLTDTWLGMFINNSCINMTRNLFDQQFVFNKTEGVYGDKLVGSGLKGAHFLLINPAHKEEIIKHYEKDYNVVEVYI